MTIIEDAEKYLHEETTAYMTKERRLEKAAVLIEKLVDELNQKEDQLIAMRDSLDAEMKKNSISYGWGYSSGLDRGRESMMDNLDKYRKVVKEIERRDAVIDAAKYASHTYEQLVCEQPFVRAIDELDEALSQLEDK